MKKALDSYLTGAKPVAQEGSAIGPTEFDDMFGEDEEGEEMDPLESALRDAGFEIDESKLTKIRSILEAESGEAKPLAGEETPEEEALEAGMGGGKVPSAMSTKAGRKF